MNLSIKKISILILLIINFLFIGCDKKENCFLCDGYGKLSCAVCEKKELKEKKCQFCDGNGESKCTLCNGTGIEKNNY